MSPRNAVAARAFRLSALAVAATVLVASCGLAPATRPVNSTSSTGVSRHGAPPMTMRPLSVAKYLDNICRLYPERNAIYLGDSKLRGVLEDGPHGTVCRWNGANTSSEKDAWFKVESPQGGLDSLYERKNEFDTWEPGDISGWPTVVTVNEGFKCRMTMAVSAKDLITAERIFTNPKRHYPEKPCSDALSILRVVLLTLFRDVDSPSQSNGTTASR